MMSEWVYIMSDWVHIMSVNVKCMSVYDEWMQWVLGVGKDKNVECVWRMVGECGCERLKKRLATLSVQIIMCDVWYIGSLFQ